MSKFLLGHLLFFPYSFRAIEFLFLLCVDLAFCLELHLLIHHLLLQLLLSNHLLFLPCSSCSRCCPYFDSSIVSLPFWSREWSQMSIYFTSWSLGWHYFSRCGTSSRFSSWSSPLTLSVSSSSILSNIMGTYWVKEVWILTVSITVSLNSPYNFCIFLVFIFPSTCTVLRIGTLEPTQELSVIISDLGNFLDSVRSVQTVICIESARIWFWLLSWVYGYMSRRFQIDLKHLS